MFNFKNFNVIEILFNIYIYNIYIYYIVVYSNLCIYINKTIKNEQNKKNKK